LFFPALRVFCSSSALSLYGSFLYIHGSFVSQWGFPLLYNCVSSLSSLSLLYCINLFLSIVILLLSSSCVCLVSAPPRM
jgi:hypothetical protein